MSRLPLLAASALISAFGLSSGPTTFELHATRDYRGDSYISRSRLPRPSGSRSYFRPRNLRREWKRRIRSGR